MALEDRRVYQEACIRCSQCKFVPMPESKEFSSICPSIDYGNFNAYSGGGQVISSYALMEGKAKVTPTLVDSVYACTMCGACDTACKTNQGDGVEPLDTLYELRAHLAKHGHAPAVCVQMMERLRRDGSHLGERADRSRWAESLGIKDATRESVEVLLHVDGSNAFDRSQWPQLRVLVQLLRAAQVDFGIAYDAESDAGGLAYNLGFQADALELARHQQRLLQQSGAQVLLAGSAEAYAAFRALYPRMGVTFGSARVLHTTEFIETLLNSGRLRFSAAAPMKATYHDPCRLGRLSEPFTPWVGKWITVLNTMLASDSPRPVRYGNGGNYEAPRQLLRRVEGLDLVEMERNRQFAYCCGAAAGAPEAYPKMAQMAAVNRLREAQSTGASCVVTACAGCQRHLAAAAAAHSIDIEVRGVFDVLANSLSQG
jgi:dimethylglycine catabolism B